MSKTDVQNFSLNLENNLFGLREELSAGRYFPSKYEFFYVRDPKLRPIHKATVKDRVVFQAVFRVLYHIFDCLFIFDSYSCRFKKSTHAGVKRLEEFAKKESKNYSRNIFVLKCDVKQFFYSIDQQLLWDLIKARIKDGQTLDLIKKIIRSFETSPGKGLPLGNVTSQLFANIYLNELDQFVKHVLQEKFYIRYCDDFIFLHEDKKYLEKLKNIICQFVENKLHLTIHPDKIFLQKFRQGLDFLGYVLLPHYRVLRTKTKQRMFKKIKKKVEEFNDNLITDFDLNQSVQSYLGMLTHCQGYNLETKLKNRCGLGVVAEEKIC